MQVFSRDHCTQRVGTLLRRRFCSKYGYTLMIHATNGKGLHSKDGLGMVGYCLKEEDLEHCVILASDALTPQLREVCKRRYLLCGNISTKGKMSITPWNLAEKMATFVSQRRLPLSMPAHSVLVHMYRSKLVYPGRAWMSAATGGGRGISCRRLNALLRLLTDPENCRLADIEIVHFDSERVPWTEADARTTVPLTRQELEAAELRAAAGSSALPPPEEQQLSHVVLKENLDYVFYRGLKPRFNEHESPRAIFHVGPSGSGKSRTVYADLLATRTRFFNLVVSSGVTVWWDGYTDEDTLVCNDLIDTDHDNETLLPWATMRSLIDHAPASFQTRDGNPRLVHCMVKTSIFTSTISPELWYVNKLGEPLSEWRRRIREFGIVYEHSMWGMPPRISTGASYLDRQKSSAADLG
jgi:RNA helicase